MDRIARLQELNQLIQPLRGELLELQILEQLGKISPEQKLELTRLLDKLWPLLKEFDTLRVKYRGELYNYQNDTHYWSEPVIEEFYLNTLCEIDALTLNNTKLDGFPALMEEASNFLNIVRIGQPQILDIKKIS